LISVSVFGIVLLGAVLHATWNAIVKGAGDKLLTTVMVAASASALSALALPFLARPATASWRYIAGSAVLQIVYFVLVARTYQSADMSQSYPLMRGTAPLLVAVIGLVWIGEHLAVTAWVGVGVICLGILSMALAGGQAGRSKGTAPALLTAIVIAGYTLVDGAGVRLSGTPAAYTLWEFLLTGIPLVAWVLIARRPAFVVNVRRYGHLGLIGGFGTLGSYGLALWAMTVAPVAVIAALRETSILFGTVIAVVFLKEQVSGVRIVAACTIALGAILLRLA
jgi:drug/metabolite transporter (DMT)-like permease